MQEVTTIPGKTYAVECAGEVVITNNETGAIAAQGDGSGQVLFTACGNSYSVSDDTAKVVALFKLAPRLNLLLQGVAGGLLPTGYTKLEYVDVVKQFAHDSVITTNAPEVDLDMMYVYKANDNSQMSIIASTSSDGYYGYSRLNYFTPSYSTIGLRLVNDSANRTYYPANGSGVGNTAVSRYDGKVPWVANRRVQYHIHDCGYTLNGTFYQFEPSEVINANWGKMEIGSAVSQNGNHYRIYRLTVKQNGVKTADLLPCLRVEDGTPGFWCRVMKKFYAQSQAATLALWDLRQEDGDNGVRYANVGEAYDGLGVAMPAEF